MFCDFLKQIEFEIPLEKITSSVECKHGLVKAIIIRTSDDLEFKIALQQADNWLRLIKDSQESIKKGAGKPSAQLTEFQEQSGLLEESNQCKQKMETQHSEEEFIEAKSCSMHCPKCGSLWAKGDVFCKNDGTRLITNIESENKQSTSDFVSETQESYFCIENGERSGPLTQHQMVKKLI